MEPGMDHDPTAERVRAELARLGADADSAPAVPAAVAARIGAALRSAAGPAHSVAPPGLGRTQKAGLVAGLGALLAGVVIGAVMATREPARSWSTGPTAKQITRSQPSFPLSEAQITGLLATRPDFGPLDDPLRRASCLAGLGHPAAPVLGARPVEMAGRPAVLMLVPGVDVKDVIALVVEPNCGSAHTGLLADTVVTRP
jgi:hypothetical protein